MTLVVLATKESCTPKSLPNTALILVTVALIAVKAAATVPP